MIAHPTDHVRAPMIFNPRFAAIDLGHVMVPIDTPPAQLEMVIAGLRAISNFGGLAVTIPHKLALADLCDTLGTAAQLTGAVNAVRFNDDGSMHGDNFDGAGFVAGCLGNGDLKSRAKIFCSSALGEQHAPSRQLCVRWGSNGFMWPIAGMKRRGT